MKLRTRLEELCGAEHVGLWKEAVPTASIASTTSTASGQQETLTVAPENEEQLREILRLAALDSKRVLPAGATEHLRARDAAAADLVLSLRRFDQTVDYEPEDQTLVAQAGVTLRSLDTLVHAHQQCMPIDCARGVAATVGGAVAGNRVGLDRLLHGTWRDHVLGARVMHADGTVTQTGSRVVKSVAGYDLSKLYVGSRGSLVVLLSVNLRLLHAPEVTSTVVAPIPVATAGEALQALHTDRRLMPSSILLAAEPQRERRTQEFVAVVRFAGRAEVVARQVEICLSRLGGQLVSQQEGDRLAESLRGLMAGSPDRAGLRLVTLPVAVVGPATELVQCLDTDSGFVAHYGVGTLHLSLTRDGVRQAIDIVQKQTAPNVPAVNRVAARWDNVPLGWPLPAELATAAPALSLQQALQREFDPTQVLQPTPDGFPSRFATDSLATDSPQADAQEGGAVGARDST